MPPSGFSQPAINGLLRFVRDNYQQTLDQYRGRDLSESQVLHEAKDYLKQNVEQSASALGMPISREGIKGLQEFVSGNFNDLIVEILVGKKEEGQAIETEIRHISEYLARFKLD